MAKIGVGGTKYRDSSRGNFGQGLIDAPPHVLAELSKKGVPEVLRAPLPKYPPGDPRNAAAMPVKEKLVVEIPDAVGTIVDDPEAIGRNAERLSKKKLPKKRRAA